MASESIHLRLRPDRGCFCMRMLISLIGSIGDIHILR